MRVVVALGGNALSPPGASAHGAPEGSAEQMRAALRPACDCLAELLGGGAQIVVTHGNGPQVGRLLLQQEAGLAAAGVPPLPMDVCGALSQGEIGYLLVQQLDTALRARGFERVVLALLTQVVVDPADPAFQAPSKPVGPTYGAVAAKRLGRAGVVLAEVEPGAFRRVVPSPEPQRIIEASALRSLVDTGHVLVAAGGGGVPVVETAAGYEGVEAVVDKDLTAAVLAAALDADLLLVLTTVDHVEVDHGTARARPLRRLAAAEARRLLAEGQFPAGSMAPKILACLQAVAEGRRAVVTSLAGAAAALAGEGGTEVVP